MNVESFENFWDELETNPCGRGLGCDRCVGAFEASCRPILAAPGDGVVHVDFAAEEDTELDIRPVFYDDLEYAELGGES